MGRTPKNCVARSTRGLGRKKTLTDWSGYNSMYSVMGWQRYVKFGWGFWCWEVR